MCRCSTPPQTSTTTCKRNENSGFCRADDRRGRQWAPPLPDPLEHVDLLRRFYGQVLVPDLVAGELTTVGAPEVVREWMANPPMWVEVRPVTADAISLITDDLDPGERAAIALAETVAADLL